MATTQIKNGFHGGTDDQLLVNPDGSINVNTTGSGGSNPSVGPTGATAPVQATEIGAVDTSGNLQHLLVDNAGALIVNSSGTSVVTGTVVSTVAGLGSFQTSQYPVGTSAVQLAPSPLAGRSSISITIEADPNIAVFIGNSSTVTVLNGYPLYDGSTLQLDLTPTGSVWAICSIAGQTAAILEIA